MKTSTTLGQYLLLAGLFLPVASGCAGSKQQAVDATAPSTAKDASDGSDGDLGDEGNELGQSEGGLMSNECLSKSDCKKLDTSIVAAETATGKRVTRLKGSAYEALSWAFRANLEDDAGNDVSSSYQSSDRYKIGITDQPAGEDDFVAESKGSGLIVLWTPSQKVSGSFTVLARDVSRCIFEEIAKAKADSEKEKNKIRKSCRDLAESQSKYDTTETFSYEISESKIDREANAAKTAIDAQCKSALVQAALGGITGIFSGNALGGVLTAGASGFGAQQDCAAKKAAIDAEVQAKKP